MKGPELTLLSDKLDDLCPLPSRFFERLAEVAEKEDWGGEGFPFLGNLVRLQFMHLYSTKNLIRTKDGQILFRLSLLSAAMSQPIVILLIPDSFKDVEGRKPFSVPEVLILGDKKCRGFNPPCAIWFNDSLMPVWDARSNFNHDILHMVEEKRIQLRLPPKYDSYSDHELHSLLVSAIARAKNMCDGDPTVAIPFVYIPKGMYRAKRFQFLLPIYLDDSEVVSMALVVDICESGYRSSTILGLHEACKNARALGRNLKWTWLGQSYSNPTKIQRAEHSPSKTSSTTREIQRTSSPKQDFSTTKKKPCDRFLQTGFCAYGDKCYFLH